MGESTLLVDLQVGLRDLPHHITIMGTILVIMIPRMNMVMTAVVFQSQVLVENREGATLEDFLPRFI
jgi:hypothetical protein